MRLWSIWLLRDAVAEYSRGNRALSISVGYAVIVIGAAVFVTVDTALKPGSLAGMWLFLATLPSSLLLQFLPAEGAAYMLFLTLGGLVQAWLLWVIVRGKRISSPAGS
ncbi:SCO4225 family membrane protein [Haloechinothrix salitolerans]|uniref:SCO4225 family membrane protein n=1 Tax=Haloechinothrix salitolerans TaxID=926830 RepID=A0ABW2C764_9PSEU